MKKKSSVRITRGGRSISFSGPIANDVFKAMTDQRPSPEATAVLKSIVQIADACDNMNNTHPSENHP